MRVNSPLFIIFQQDCLKVLVRSSLSEVSPNARGSAVQAVENYHLPLNHAGYLSVEPSATFWEALSTIVDAEDPQKAVLWIKGTRMVITYCPPARDHLHLLTLPCLLGAHRLSCCNRAYSILVVLARCKLTPDKFKAPSPKQTIMIDLHGFCVHNMFARTCV